MTVRGTQTRVQRVCVGGSHLFLTTRYAAANQARTHHPGRNKTPHGIPPCLSCSRSYNRGAITAIVIAPSRGGRWAQDSLGVELLYDNRGAVVVVVPAVGFP